MQNWKRLRFIWVWGAVYLWILFGGGWKGGLVSGVMLLLVIAMLVWLLRWELCFIERLLKDEELEREAERLSGRTLSVGAPGCWREDRMDE